MPTQLPVGPPFSAVALLLFIHQGPDLQLRGLALFLQLNLLLLRPHRCRP